MPEPREWDVLVAGGGPAGAAAGLQAARQGLRTLIIEKDRHPRFHIGESMLPQASAALRRLGLEDQARALPHVPKFGGSFALGHETTFTDFAFRNSLVPADPATLSVERAPFDRMLLEAAADAGATLLQEHRVRKVIRLETGRVELALAGPDGGGRTVAGHHLLDASGQGTLVGHHLRTRSTLPDFKRVALYEHFTGVSRRPGVEGGYTLVVMCEEGWFWLIPLDDERTSIGWVMGSRAAKRLPVPQDRALRWLLQRCPLTRRLTRDLDGPDVNRVASDFSYTCRPFAGPGYFLLGDAATFIDPIFSSGVCMGLMSALQAVDLLVSARAGRRSWPAAYRIYDRYVAGSSKAFFDIVRLYYRHSFREMFLHGQGPFEMQRALTTLLTGQVFPRPPWPVRWRLAMFKALVRLHPRLPLVPRRERFAILEGA